jgi:monoamine oxidase
MPLSGRVAIQQRHELVSLAREANGIHLGFRTESGPPLEKTFSRVVMALPFTRLREVKGLGGLALPADKMKVIAELGYGAQAKLAVATSAPPAGRIWSDRGFQSAWNGAAGQPGEGGIVSNLFAGEAARGEEARALARLESGLASLSPDLARGLTPKLRASFFWPSHPHTKGARAACLVGQYTRYPEIAARLELDGRMAFAGEHTSLTGMGTMNGAVEAGERAASQLLTPA